MSLSITIELHDEPLQRALAALAGMDATAMYPALDAIGAAMEAKTQLRFREGVAPDGGQWLPSKRVQTHGGQTLVDTARLVQSITHNVIGDGVEWGTNVIYAAIQQFGGTIHRQAGKGKIYRKVSKSGELSRRFVKQRLSNYMTEHDHGAYDIVIPARPYLGIDADDENEMTQILADHLQRAIEKGAG